jgi:amino acid adenylation domain-containing protein
MADGDSKISNKLDLQAAKHELLTSALEKEGIESYNSQKIFPRQYSDNTPLSFAQERLWFLDQLEPGHSVYNVCRAQRLTGPLDVINLTQSINEIVRRHEILRTTFPCVDGVPLQVATPTFTLTIPVVNLQELPRSVQEAETSRIAVEEAQCTFNLAMGPLLRAKLLRLGEERHVLLLTTHQIVCDGWSLGVFFRELSNLYDAYSSGKDSSLEDLPIQYADFAAWQRQWLQGEVLETQISYWQKQLGHSLPTLGISTDRPRPAVQSFRGAREPVVLSEDLAKAVRILDQRAGVTTFMILLAVFNTLLHRYTGQADLLVGCPFGNRHHLETENLIGSFVNTLVLRTNLDGDPPFSELLSRVRDTCLGAYAHQDLPFEKLVVELDTERDLSRNPLFQAMFVFQNRSVSSLNLPGLTSEPIEVDTETSKFDFTLSLTDRGNDLAGFFEYNTDLFRRSTIEGIIAHFRMLLEGILADPDKPISALTLLNEAERHQVLVKWNETEADYPKNSCIHELFEAQVERTPEAIAVEFDGKRFTYEQLNHRANQLARYLKILGVGPERLVGICVERSLEMVVGVLGTLKAGGAYVPLDPAFPGERLEFMLEDARVSALLTEERLIEVGRSKIEDGGDPPFSILDPQIRMIRLDRDRERIAQQSERNLDKGATAQDLAYVIYTSGSTGQPKGVQIEHRSVVNCLHSIRHYLELTENEVFLAVTTMSFDIAALEVYLPLMVGAKLVLASREEVLDGKLLVDRITASSVTAMQATPSAWRLLLDAGWRGSEGFKILCGGEVLSRELADELLEGGASLWNLYGPTETTIWSTIAKVEPSESPVSIGRPIANTQIYILDSHLQPVPAGVHGELYIGGDGLARGYLNRPELTAEKFVANPFSNQPGARLYRTGDRARYRADGNIEFLGRGDNQVKIRGYRIELGEIEAALNQHPTVKDSVVVARARDSTGEKELVGYIVANQDSVASTSDLRSLLREKLPDYMIPSAFVFLNALPLTPNRKVDRSKLLPPDDSRPSLDQGFVEPRSEIEELVAQVWREVLKLDKIGVYDNFFELGGHSLLATRVVARLRSNFNVDLPLRKLFELPTVAGLAEHIDFLRHNQSGVSVPPIMPVSRDRAIPLSFSQRRLWFLQKLDPNFTAYNIPAIFRIEGDLNISALEKALREIVNRHEVLRTRVVEIDGQPLQQIIFPLMVTLPVIDLEHLPEDQAAAEVQQLSADDAHQPYNLQEAPLMRAKLLRLGEQEYVLILNFHHIVCDGSSLIIFYHELATLYEAFLDGKVSILPSLPVQYADYAVWQHERLQGEVLKSQLAYWKRQLGTGLTTLNLPTDYERPVVQTYRGARLTRTLSEELTKGLEDVSRREGVTLFMTLLASVNILLSRHTGQDDIILGATIAGRDRPETEGLIGFFINALALRTDLSGNPTFLELLKRVRDICLDAYTHQDLPFERVVEEINPQRDLSRNPLFQVMFNMADTSERTLTLPGCTVTKISSADPSAKFDIVLHAPEVDGRIELAIVYNADLFSERRIINVLNQFTHLLSQVAEKPQKRLDQYTLVTLSMQAVLPDPTEPLDKTWHGAIHTLFSKQAEHQSDRLAVVDRNETWTYRELDNRSNQLANYLMVRGIQPKDGVAIYAHRSAPLVLALLAALKAGAAFVILDPAYPAQRLIDYLKIAQPKGWLQMEAAGELPEELSVFLDSLEIPCRIKLPRMKHEIADSLSHYPESETGVPVNGDDPAYIAFTSGSTGQPKGVLCRHGPITHFLPWQEETFDLRGSDRFSLLSGLGYNHLHRDVFTAVSLGATVYVPTPQVLASPDRLTEWLLENEITILHLTPALGQLLQTSYGRTFPSVHNISFGGDVLTKGDVARIREIAPNAKIGNRYGATETQRAIGYFKVPDDYTTNETNKNQIVPIGRGAKDVQLLLLTPSGQLTGVGELGELYVRSPHLAAGYVGDEVLTQENFLINPFTKDERDRLYRTGELGRYLPDGNVEWVGRKDRRVSIRGFRVELAEVESVLSQCAGVKHAAVIAKEFVIGGANELRLIAYVETEQDQSPSIDGLRCFLSARLPNYMVPSYFLFVDHLPLSPNGKVDYFELPPSDQFLRPAEDQFEAPRTVTEQTLGRIFSEVLGLDQVGRYDNFFHLGGHSLLAAQAAARIKEAFGVALELRTFLESPTVAELTRQIGSLLSVGQTTEQSVKEEREEIEI